jgi:hypothetical protein
MGTEFWILSIGGSLLINVILWIIAVRIFSAVYQNKFDALVGIIRDAMTERDMKLRKIEAMLARAVVTDTRLFDGMIDIEDEEDIPHEREEEDTD